MAGRYEIMKVKGYGWLILALAILVLAFSISVREFLKITFIMGIPFIFLLRFWINKPRYSPLWFVYLTGLVLIVGMYGYMLTTLPERIEVRRIVIEGANLEAKGDYDQAIKEYGKLGELGKTSKMEDKIKAARKEKEGYLILQEAEKLIKQGRKEEGLKLLQTIPEDTRAYHEAQKIKRDYEDGSSGP